MAIDSAEAIAPASPAVSTARAAGRARDAGHDPEHRSEPVVGAVDRARDPAGAGPVPLLASEDPVEPGPRPGMDRGPPRRRAEEAERAVAHRRGITGARPRAHVGHGQRVRALLLADLAQQPIGLEVSGRALVEVVDLLVLGRLARGQQPVDGRDRACRRSHSGTLIAAGSGMAIPSWVMRSSSRRRWPLSASAMRRRMSASRGASRRAISP